MINYQILCQDVKKIAKETGNFIKQEGGKITKSDVKLKSLSSLVTYVDKSAELQIVEKLKPLIPSAGFITEEGTASSSDEKYRWIVDPLDGTTNFVHGITPHSVSIALMENRELVLGVVYEIGRDEIFYAWKGSPAYLNGTQISTATNKKPEETLISTGFPYYDFNMIDKYIASMKYLMEHSRGIRRMGSAAVDLSYVAAGRFDAFYEHALHAWDVAAGAFILKQAGGIISDFNGGDNWLFGKQIIAASSSYFDIFYPVINKYMGD
ncbi:MAG: inositol monophosphatase [Bacteroidales bacterium]|nr:inositol monophosphatase [Bacteroidales bacterium]